MVSAVALTTDFTRGLVATGLLSLLQGRGANAGGAPDFHRVWRQALQGGVALAAGSAAAEAIQRRDYLLAVSGVAAGAAAIYGIEQFMRPALRREDREN